MFITFCLHGKKKTEVQSVIESLKSMYPQWFNRVCIDDEIKKKGSFFVYYVEIDANPIYDDIRDYVFAVRERVENTGVNYVYLYYGEKKYINSDITGLFFETQYFLEYKADNGTCRYFGSGVEYFKSRLPEILNAEGLSDDHGYVFCDTMADLTEYLSGIGIAVHKFSDGNVYTDEEYAEWKLSGDVAAFEDECSDDEYSEDEIKTVCRKMKDIVVFLHRKEAIAEDDYYRLNQDIDVVVDLADGM